MTCPQVGVFSACSCGRGPYIGRGSIGAGAGFRSVCGGVNGSNSTGSFAIHYALVTGR